MNFIIVRDDTELLEERSKLQKDAKEWDIRILKLSSLLTLIAYIVAGLDSGRYHWSERVQWEYCLIGVAFILSGQLLFGIAKKTNKFFSSVVRIQTDRGQTVCEAGIYRFVRHPGYLGMIISWIGFPVLLESAWSAIPVLCAIILLLKRTHLEEKILLDELTGYDRYTQKTHYKLVPGIW